MIVDINRRLTRSPRSLFDRLKYRVEHREARLRFDRGRCVHQNGIDALFPGIEGTRALMHYTCTGSAMRGNMPLQELWLLCTICSFCRPERIFEFGTFHGLTTLHFALNSPEAAVVHTIDLAPDDPIRRITTDDTYYTADVPVGGCFSRADKRNKIHQILCNSTDFDHSALRGQVDMIFIDAGHTYEAVKADTGKALEMIRPGGVILWHDYHYTQVGVSAWLNELSGSLPLFNVLNTSLVVYRS